MVQIFTDNIYEPTFNINETMENSNNNFLALESNFSGVNSPPNAVTGNTWFKKGSNESLCILTSLQFYSCLLGEPDHKMYFYRNNSNEGWILDPTIQDVILSVKGGTNAYNVDGGTIAGTWTQPGHTHGIGSLVFNHTHTSRLRLADKAETYNERSYGSLQEHPAQATSGVTGTQISSTNTWRPQAAVGTLQMPDMA